MLLTRAFYFYKTMKTTFYILYILLSASGCSNNTNATVMETFIEPVLIAKGHLSANETFTKENRVITDNEDWQEITTAMQAINNDITFTETDIDFSDYIVIAVLDIKNSTTTIDITQVKENEDAVVITVENLKRGITQDVAHPYHIIKIRKTGKPIIFE